MLATLLVTGFAFAFGWLVGREHPSPEAEGRIAHEAKVEVLRVLEDERRRELKRFPPAPKGPRLVVSNADFPQGAA
jgi:hypothetical protein